MVVIHQVAMTLWQFNIILYVQGSNTQWVQGDKACKIKVQLDLNKLDLLPINNWRLAHLELAKRTAKSAAVVISLTCWPALL